MNANLWKRLGILLGAAAVLFIAAVILLPQVVDLNPYRDAIAKEIADALGGEAKLGHIRWGIGKKLWVAVDGFSVSGSRLLQGDIRFARIYGEVSMIPLLSRKIVIQDLQLEAPHAKFQLNPSLEKKTTAAEKPPIYEPVPVAPPTALPVEIVIEKVSLKDGKLTVKDLMTLPGHPMTHTFADVEIEATNLVPGRQIPFHIKLRDVAASGLGMLNIRGTFSGLTQALTLKNPELTIKANLPAIDIDVIRPYAKDYGWLQGLRGKVAADVSITSNLGSDLHSDGSIDLGATVFEDPSSGEKIQPKAGMKIAFRIALSDNRLTVHDFDLLWANLSLKASAIIEDLHEDPIIKNVTLSSELPLTELAYIMPWKKLGAQADRIREILSGGGHITVESASIPDMKLSRLTDQLGSLITDSQLTARFSGISAYTLPKLPVVQGVEGTLRLEKGVIRIDGLNGRIGTATLPSISAVIINLLDAPEVQAKLNGTLVVGSLTDKKMIELLRPAGINKMAGEADLDLSLKLAFDKPEDFQLNGTIDLRAFSLTTAFIPVGFENIHLKADVAGDAVDVSDGSLIINMPAVEKSPAGKFKVTVSGKVFDLRKRPKVSLRRLTTDPISLPTLVSVLPWDALGKESEEIKQIFLAGGTVSIEALETPIIDLTSPPKDMAALAERITAVIRVADIDVKPGPNIPGIEGITGRVSLKKGVLIAEKIALRHGAVVLPDLNVHATHLFTRPKIDAQLKGHIRVGKPSFPNFKEMLLEYGFKDVAGEADVSLRFRYDHAKPKAWEAEGSLAVKDLRGVSHPKGVIIQNLNADVAFTRKKRFDIDIRKLSTRLNESPISLEGKFSLEGDDTFLIDAKARAAGLDLTDLVAVTPSLRAMTPDLKGRVDLDVDIHLPSRNPAASKMTGTITTRDLGFKLSAPPLIVKDGNSRLQLADDTIFIKSMTASVNDQKLSLVGKTVRPFLEPDAQWKITASELDLDKLLPASNKKTGDAKTSLYPDQDRKADTVKSVSDDKKAEEKKLPLDWDRTVAHIQVAIAKLRYRGNLFENVTGTADYRRGVLKPYNLKATYGQSDIQASGALDVRCPERIDFEIKPNIQALPMQALKPLLGIEKVLIHGPLSISGNVKGRTGPLAELLTSLNGQFEATVGKGRYLETGTTTDLLSRILSITNVQSILNGGILGDVTSNGIPFDQIVAEITLDGGKLNIDAFQFLSSVMNMSAKGNIDLVKQNLNAAVELEPFEIVNKALNLVPLAGKIGQILTRYTVSVSGPVDKPEIRLGAVKKVTDSLKKEEKEDKKTEEKGFKGILPRLF